MQVECVAKLQKKNYIRKHFSHPTHQKRLHIPVQPLFKTSFPPNSTSKTLVLLVLCQAHVYEVQATTVAKNIVFLRCGNRGSTKVRAGDKLFTLNEAEVPNSHKTVCGHTPPLS